MADLTGDESPRTPSVTAQRETTVLSFPTSNLPAAAGEEDFTGFFTRMYGPLCSYAEGYVNADAAEDIVQTALIAIWRQYLKKGRLPGGSADVLAYRAVTFRIRNWRRGRYREARRLGEYLKDMPA